MAPVRSGWPGPGHGASEVPVPRGRGVAVIAVAAALLAGCGGSKNAGERAATSGEAATDSQAATSAGSPAAAGAPATVPATTAPSSPGARPPVSLASLLLVAADLGEGWHGKSGTVAPGPSGLLNLCSTDVSLGGPASAATLAHDARGDFVTHLVRHYDTPDHAAAAVKAVGQAGGACKEWTLTAGNRRERVRIQPIGYAIVGQGRAAFRLLIDGEDRDLNADYFVWHHGGYVEAVLNTATRVLDPDLTMKAVATADKRLVVTAGVVRP